jgi:type I restriction enzyme S subunit
MAIAGGSAKSMSNISKERLGKLQIMLPPISHQKTFSAFVTQVDKSKVIVQKALDEAQLLFDSLMQEYFG